MSNDEAKSRRWAEFVASRPYLDGAAPVLDHFLASRITRLCECGCQSFDVVVESDARLAPLVPPTGRGRCVLSLFFRVADALEPLDVVEIDVFVDGRGFLAGIDVAVCGNPAPMPDRVELVEPPVRVDGTLNQIASNYRLERP
jgi:hypothetical protein